MPPPTNPLTNVAASDVGAAAAGERGGSAGEGNDGTQKKEGEIRANLQSRTCFYKKKKGKIRANLLVCMTRLCERLC